MRKLYYIVPLAMAAGLFVSCDNDTAGTEEIIPQETIDGSLGNATRAFPEDDGAKALTGEPARMFWMILQGVDDAFPRRRAGYEIEDFQYEEIKQFTDQLIADKKATTETEKYQAIWNWVTSNIKYNNPLNPAYGNDPYDVFTNKVCVCQGYANILSVMLHSQGIDVLNVNGILGGYGGHAWNYVRIDGEWWVSDPTNGGQHKASLVGDYQHSLIPYSADGNFLETPEYAYNYTECKLNLNVVKQADDVMTVPFSVTLNNGKRYRVTSFSPSKPLPENVRELYIGTNIESLGESIIGLKNNAPNVEVAYVEPDNKNLRSFNGVVYPKRAEEPLYIPAAMKKLVLQPWEVIGKNHVFDHAGIEEIVIANGTKRLEAWAVEKCPNLKVACVPMDTEIDENAFVDVHPDFEVIRMDQTGIKDIWAD